MKKTLLFFILVQSVSVFSMQAQTHYGTGAGTLGTNHSYFGYYAGNASTNSSSYNSFFGSYCGRNTVTGNDNTAVGSYAFYHNTEGSYNTAIGSKALYDNTYGDSNVAIGRNALRSSNNYGYETANGYEALSSAVETTTNTATGTFALQTNTTGYSNVATGFQTLSKNLTGYSNVATGAYALTDNTTGDHNTAYGSHALSITGGSLNTAFGFRALYWEGSNNCNGSHNTAFGVDAGFAPTAGCDLDNTSALGYNTRVTASNQVRIGNSNVTSIGGQVSWSALSDGRFKKDLKKDVAGLDFINQLNPVSYTLDRDAFDKFLGISNTMDIAQAEARKTPQLQVGFIAQEVEAIIKKSGYVFSGIETPQNENDPYTIRYAEFVVPLVKAVQELAVIADAREREIFQLEQTLREYLEATPSDGKRSTSATFQNSSGSLSGNEIHIALPTGIVQADLIVYSPEGKEIKDIRVDDRGDTTVKISGSEFHPGTYLYALIADGKLIMTDELTIE